MAEINEAPGSPADPAMPLLSRRVLTDDVHEWLTARIMDNEIAPNTKVSIDEIARRLGVSPTPVREALARLEEAGLVRKESLRGYFTTPLLTRREFEDLFEFRRHLEPWAAGRAADKLTADGEARLRAELQAGGAVPSGADYGSYRTLTNHDSRFHQLLFELAGNPVMGDAFRRTHCHLHLFRLYYGTDLASPAVDEHRLVVEALAERDSARSQAAMLDHLGASYARLSSAAT